mgnify:FL=1
MSEIYKKLYQTIPNIIGVKESGSAKNIDTSLIKWKWWAGNDINYIDYLNAEAFGIISMVANIYPKEMLHAIKNKFTSYEFNQKIINICKFSNPVGVKFTAHKLNLISTPYTRFAFQLPK